jgi:hypothetical protein
MLKLTIKKNTVWVNPRGSDLANRLINKMQITNGAKLASYLELDYPTDNHTAIELWIQRILTLNQGRDLRLETLQGRLVSTIPTYLQGDIDNS